MKIKIKTFIYRYVYYVNKEEVNSREKKVINFTQLVVLSQTEKNKDETEFLTTLKKLTVTAKPLAQSKDRYTFVTDVGNGVGLVTADLKARKFYTTDSTQPAFTYVIQNLQKEAKVIPETFNWVFEVLNGKWRRVRIQ